MRAIQLTQGKMSIVDDRDYEWLSKVEWYDVTGYAARASSRKNDGQGKHHHTYMHRVIWEKHNGPVPKGFELDHINGNRADNRLENLRLVTQSQNSANMHKMQPHSSRFKGVSRYKRDGNWQAYYRDERGKHHLGYFDTEEEAASAYDEAARAKWGKNANPNYP